jgi:hypothetical protein
MSSLPPSEFAPNPPASEWPDRRGVSEGSIRAAGGNVTPETFLQTGKLSHPDEGETNAEYDLMLNALRTGENVDAAIAMAESHRDAKLRALEGGPSPFENLETARAAATGFQQVIDALRRANYTPPVRPSFGGEERDPTTQDYYKQGHQPANYAAGLAQYGAGNATMINNLGVEVPSTMMGFGRPPNVNAMPETQRTMASTYWESMGFPNIAEVVRSVPMSANDNPGVAGYSQSDLQRNTTSEGTILGNPVVAAHEGLHSFYFSLSDEDRADLNARTHALLTQRMGGDYADQQMEVDPVHGINMLIEWSAGGVLPPWFLDYMRGLQPERYGPLRPQEVAR